jgi:hypothetical protein
MPVIPFSPVLLLVDCRWGLFLLLVDYSINQSEAEAKYYPGLAKLNSPARPRLVKQHYSASKQ